MTRNKRNRWLILKILEQKIIPDEIWRQFQLIAFNSKKMGCMSNKYCASKSFHSQFKNKCNQEPASQFSSGCRIDFMLTFVPFGNNLFVIGDGLRQ